MDNNEGRNRGESDDEFIGIDKEVIPKTNSESSGRFSKVISYGSSLLAPIFSSSIIDVKLIADHELLRVNNELSTLFSVCIGGDGRKIDFDMKFPEIALVGSQSSGKSSIITNILGIPLPPTGEHMVTRTPVVYQTQNIQNTNTMKFEFGENKSGIWTPYKIYEFGIDPSEQELTKVREEIRIQTIKRAGPRLGISDIPIFIRIQSPKIHDLTFVDLPGIATISYKEEDQPEDIEDQIKKMIQKYICSDKTIIVVAAPATGDLEADVALGFVKKHDKDGRKTIVVLTKVDLMNKETDVKRYITGMVPRELKFDRGYYAVKNRTPAECKTISIAEGIKNEELFFKQHPTYSTLTDQSRLGTVSLIKGLKNILIEQIRFAIPDIVKEIKTREEEINGILKILGPCIPIKIDEQLTRLSILVSKFCHHFNSCFEELDTKFNVGRQIRDIFDQFRSEVDVLNPFTKEHYSDEYISNIIKNCEGDHMNSPIPTITVFEKCIRDPTKKPILLFKIPSEKCVQNIQGLICDIISEFSSMDEFIRFPKLMTCIRDEITSKLLPQLYDKSIDYINISIESEDNYIWTDNESFKKLLIKEDDKQNHPLRTLLIEYFKLVKIIVKNNVPKLVKRTYIKEIQTKLFDLLINIVTASHVSSSLLEENPEQTQKRKLLEMQRDKLMAAKNILRIRV